MSNDDANASENGVRDKRGILTKDDREFLLGQKKLSEGGSYNRRRFIRDRLYHALLDFRLLYEFMPDRDRERVFDEIKDMGEEGGGALAAIFALVYLETSEPHIHAYFPDLLEYGVRHAEYQLLDDADPMQTVNVDFSVNRESPWRTSFSAIADKIEAGRWKDITDDEARSFLFVYAESDEFDRDVPSREHEQYLKEQRADAESNSSE